VKKFITKVNKFSKDLLGLVGRPVAAAVGAGGAMYGVGYALDNEIMAHPAAVIGTGLVTAGAIEGVLHGFGRDPEVRAEFLAADIKKLVAQLKGVGDAAEKKKIIDAATKDLPESAKSQVVPIIEMALKADEVKVATA